MLGTRRFIPQKVWINPLFYLFIYFFFFWNALIFRERRHIAASLSKPQLHLITVCGPSKLLLKMILTGANVTESAFWNHRSTTQHTIKTLFSDNNKSSVCKSRFSEINNTITAWLVCVCVCVCVCVWRNLIMFTLHYAFLLSNSYKFHTNTMLQLINPVIDSTRSFNFTSVRFSSIVASKGWLSFTPLNLRFWFKVCWLVYFGREMDCLSWTSNWNNEQCG